MVAGSNSASPNINQMLQTVEEDAQTAYCMASCFDQHQLWSLAGSGWAGVTLHTKQNSAGGISSFVSQATSPKEAFASQATSPKGRPLRTLCPRGVHTAIRSNSHCSTCLGWVSVYLIMAATLLQPSYIQDCCTLGMVVIIQFGRRICISA